MYARKLLVGSAARVGAHGERVGTVDNLVVDQTMRRAGVGHLLLAAAVSTARNASTARLELVTETATQVGETFYRRYGWIRAAHCHDRDGRELERWVLPLCH